MNVTTVTLAAKSARQTTVTIVTPNDRYSRLSPLEQWSSFCLNSVLVEFQPPTIPIVTIGVRIRLRAHSYLVSRIFTISFRRWKIARLLCSVASCIRKDFRRVTCLPRLSLNTGTGRGHHLQTIVRKSNYIWTFTAVHVSFC